jgi:hypothetical protein
MPMIDVKSMKSWNKHVSDAGSIERARRHLLPSIGALLMLCLFFGLQLLSVSQSLHKLLHADATKAEHHCAITAIAQGQIDHTPVDIAVPLPNICYQVLVAPARVALADVPFRLLPSRGPPALA